MARPCPKHCSRLTSAAIFIASGIVQMMAGLMLLRSRHVYLLAAPDFWTALTNICVGCLVGLTANVWKYNRCNRKVNKARYGFVGALFLSTFVINAVTCGILILGEGSALLSIHAVQSESGLQTTFASEILSYAYAASVLSSIVSAVVSTISLIFMCCSEDGVSSRRNGKRRFRKKFEMDDSETYNWVYTPEKASKDFSKRALLKSISSGFSSRSSVTLSSSFGDIHTDLTSPVLKTLKQKYETRQSSTIPAQRHGETSQQSHSTPAGSFESASPLAVESEIVPIQLRNAGAYRRPPLGIPVRSPVVPQAQSEKKDHEPSGKEESTRPKTVIHSDFHDSSEDEISPRCSYNSFREDYEKSRRELRKEYQKVDAKRIHAKRPDFRRLHLMASIDECPADSENEDNWRVSSPTASSGYGSGTDVATNASSSEFRPKNSTLIGKNYLPSPSNSTQKPFEKRYMKNRLSGYTES